jgi:hydrogenase nickel incorporation protein HypA/HybF
MHEAGLFRDLRTKMIEIAEVERVPRIARVRVWVGALAHLSEARLREAWPDLVRGTPAEGSRLEVELSLDATDPRAQGIVLASVDVPREGYDASGAGGA